MERLKMQITPRLVPLASAEAASDHLLEGPTDETRLAVILAGGEGRRMGGSKPLQRLGAAPLIAHALALARGYAPMVAIAVRDPEQIGNAVKATLLIDPPAIEGPLAGLASALTYARDLGQSRVLTLPCDAPRLPADLKHRLDSAFDRDGPAGVAVASSRGRLHPTCAVWRVEAIDRLVAYVQSGRRSLTGLAGELCMVIVEWEGDELDPFVNVNTPDELAALQPGAREFGY